MIKCEVVFDGDEINISNHSLRVECNENGYWYISINGDPHDKTLEQAIKYCMEQSK